MKKFKLIFGECVILTKTENSKLIEDLLKVYNELDDVEEALHSQRVTFYKAGRFKDHDDLWEPMDKVDIAKIRIGNIVRALVK